MTAPDMEAPGEVGTEGRAQGTEANLDCAAVDDAARKAFETLRASVARSGIELYRLDGGAYLLRRWNMHRELPDLQAVRALLQRMGIRAE